MPWAELEANFDAVMSSGYSVSLFTDWRNGRFKQVWRKSRLDASSTAFSGEFYGAKPADKPMNPVPDSDPVNCTGQFGVPGPWHERLPHFRYGFKPSAGDELQSEYFVARENAVEALRSMWPLGELLRDKLLVSEVRTIAADGLWMSPCYGRDSVALHFTWKRNWPAVSKLLPVIESALAPFDARPHWGKTFTMSADRVEHLSPKLSDFRELLTEVDPNGKFRNGYLDRYVFGRG
jgi:xylitol oxidase